MGIPAMARNSLTQQWTRVGLQGWADFKRGVKN